MKQATRNAGILAGCSPGLRHGFDRLAFAVEHPRNDAALCPLAAARELAPALEQRSQRWRVACGRLARGGGSCSPVGVVMTPGSHHAPADSRFLLKDADT